MPVTELLDVLTPPTRPVGMGNAIAAAQTALGVTLPPDYADLVRRYGAGRIAGFLWVFQPGSPRETIDLASQADAQIEVLRELADEGETIPYPLFPESGGLLPAGMSDNGDTIFWRTEGTPEQWPIVVHEARGPAWWQFDGDLSGFLAASVSGRVRCPIFPASFPPPEPAFEPLTA